MEITGRPYSQYGMSLGRTSVLTFPHSPSGLCTSCVRLKGLCWSSRMHHQGGDYRGIWYCSSHAAEALMSMTAAAKYP